MKNNETSDTPRCDVHAKRPVTVAVGSYWADFARQLERENARLRESLYKLTTWAETYKRTANIHDGGPLAADIAEAREIHARTT